MQNVINPEDILHIRDGMTISREEKMEGENSLTWFSMGKGTSISSERYDTDSLYIMFHRSGEFIVGTEMKARGAQAGDMILIPGGMLCGKQSENGAIFLELVVEKELNMNEIMKAGEVFSLKEMVAYEKGSIVNLDIVKNDSMKFFLMAFDDGTGLQPHRAPGRAIITALEGNAVIGYEGKEFRLTAGESFMFEKDGLHSVTADGRFKMALLLIIG